MNSTNPAAAATVALLTLLLSALVARPARAEEWIAVKGARVIPISGPTIENGTVLVRDGRIEAVGGPEIEIPWKARTLNGAGKVVMPGYVIAHSSRGLDVANENVPNVPFVSVLDAIDPVNAAFEDALRDGVTTILVMPGNNTLIGGQGMVVKPFGRTVEAMTVKRDGGLKISMRPAGNTSRMGHVQRLRRTFIDLRDYLDELAEKKAEAATAVPAPTVGTVTPPQGPAPAVKKPEEEIDVRRKPLVDLIEGRIPAYVYCERASDVPRAFEIAEAQKFRMIPILGADCWKAAAYLAEKKTPVILDADLVTYERDEETRKEQRRVVPQILSNAGVKTMAFSVEASQYGARYPWYQAALAVRYGMSTDEALKCVTLYPAQILGLGDRVGSLEKGKDGNFLILSGDPLDYRTWVETVVIEGQIAYQKDEDARLKKLLPQPQAAAPAPSGVQK